MLFSYLTFMLAVICLKAARLVNAGLYVVTPAQGSVCQANQPCSITWLEDGRSPLLTSIGVSTVGLYAGREQLVQTISPVNVGNNHSITFTPNPAAGPNSDNYYIAFTSTTLKVNDSVPYTAYSPFFRLSGMSGSFNSPLPSATSSIPIAPSLTRSQTSSSTSTITVGSLSTTPSSSSTQSSSSSISQARLITSTSSSSTPTPTPTPTYHVSSGSIKMINHLSTSLSCSMLILTVLASSTLIIIF